MDRAIVNVEVVLLSIYGSLHNWPHWALFSPSHSSMLTSLISSPLHLLPACFIPNFGVMKFGHIIEKRNRKQNTVVGGVV